MLKPTGYIDGTIGDLHTIRVPILDRGFLYGDSIYEVLRTYAGIPFMFDEHHARLMNSAHLSRLQVTQSKAEIMRAIRATVDAAGPTRGEDIYVRYQITRGEGPVDLSLPAAAQSRLVIIVKQVPQWDADFYATGMTLAVPEVRRNAVNTLDPNIKGGNYLNNILALAAARALGADECMMLDAEDRVTECSNSNVWLVLGGEIVTPAGGNLLGLTRKTLVGLLKGAGCPVSEGIIHSAQLAAATECFVTSATREVMPVASLRLGDGNTLEFPRGGGEWTRRAMALYREMLDEFIAANRDQAWF